MLACATVVVLEPGATAAQATPTGGCYAQATISAAVVHFATAGTSAQDASSLRLGSHPKAKMLTQSPACTSSVVVGHSYSASVQYRSTASAVSLDVLIHNHRGWRVWYVARKHLAARSKLTSVSVLLAPIQGGVDRIALGLLVSSRGSVQARGFALRDLSSHPTGTPVTTGAVSPTLNLPGLPEPTAPSAPVVDSPATPGESPTEAPSEFATSGRWTVLADSAPERSVHAILLQNGKLLLMAGSGNDPMAFAAGTFKSYLYDPVADTWQSIPTPKDVFCSGHVQLSNGNVLILGGTKAYPPEPQPGEYPSTVYEGLNTSWIFNIHTDRYEEVEYDRAHPSNTAEPGPLLSGAWYPSATELGNGDVISFGGLNEEGQGDTKTNYFIDPANPGLPEDPAGEWVGFGGEKVQQTYPWYWGEYPSMILTADGRLFYDGSHVFGDGLESTEEAPGGSSLYDFYCSASEDPNHPNPNASVVGPNGTFKRVTETPGLRDPDMRDQSASLLLPPAQSQKVMIMGGANTYTSLVGSGQSAINLTDEIDLSQSNPHWTAGPNLPQGTMDNGSMEPSGAGKMYVSAVALPNGEVLETGGSEYMRADDVHEASIFNPTTNAFTPVAADPVGRDYHSEALLLPDGRVIALGSNPVDPVTGESSFETRISIYEPPYLFKGARPVLNLIDGQPNTTAADGTTQTTQWAYGSEHILSYSSASTIASAVLIRPGAVTHSSDPNQREVALPISATASGQLTVKLTGNQNIAPPGYYMVFLLNSNGVPSVARWVHVGPQGAPTG